MLVVKEDGYQRKHERNVSAQEILGVVGTMRYSALAWRT